MPHVCNFNWATHSINCIWSRNLAIIHLTHLLPENYLILVLKTGSIKALSISWLHTHSLKAYLNRAQLDFISSKALLGKVYPQLSTLDIISGLIVLGFYKVTPSCNHPKVSSLLCANSFHTNTIPCRLLFIMPMDCSLGFGCSVYCVHMPS